MSTPSEQDAAQDGKANSEPTFSEQVTQALEKSSKDSKGNIVLPEGLSEEVKFAAISEKRRLDTRSSYTQLAQKTKALETEKAILLKKVSGSTDVSLTAAQTEELEELKFSDPEAWRKKLNGYESEARNKRVSEINEELKQASSSTLDSEELERRKQVLEDFNTSHKDVTITQDLIDAEIPPRITKKLADGKITFEDFLAECYEYAKTGKVIKQDKVLDDPNLSKVGGGNSPDANAKKEDIILSYQKETY